MDAGEELGMMDDACYVCGGEAYRQIRGFSLCETHYNKVFKWGVNQLYGKGRLFPAWLERLKIEGMAENWVKGATS